MMDHKDKILFILTAITCAVLVGLAFGVWL